MDDRNPDHRTSPEVAKRVMDMLGTPDAKKVSFVIDTGGRAYVVKPVQDGKVSLSISTAQGRTRSERWDVEKLAMFMDAGFWFANLDGVVHDGGYIRDKSAAERKANRELGDVMDQFLFQGMFVRMLEGAGRNDEAAELRKAGFQAFDVGAAKAFIAQAIATAEPGFANAFVAPAIPDPEEEETLAPRM